MDLSWGQTSVVEKKQEAVGEHVQGSEQWLEWRGKGLGSSDAAVLLGWSPWKTATQLLDEKLGLWKPTFGPQQRAAMDRGKELEPRIRHWYEQNHRSGVLFPDGIATHPAREFMRASFDGINKHFKNPEDGSLGRIIEIKAPNRADHELARLGEVPDKYTAQVQWLMMVAGAIPWCDYVSYGTDGTYHVVAVQADLLLQRELSMRAELFWKHVETKTPIMEWEKFERGASFTPLDLTVAEISSAPVAPTKEEAPQIAEQEVEAIVAEALKAQEEAAAADARYEALKEKLKKIAGDASEVVRGEAVFGWNERKGNVDYSIIPELIGLDLEQFRKKPTRAFYFKRRPSR